MNLDPLLLEVIACPACHGALTADDAASTLTCDECSRTYPVRNDIPVLLLSEATQPTDAEGAGS